MSNLYLIIRTLIYGNLNYSACDLGSHLFDDCI